MYALIIVLTLLNGLGDPVGGTTIQTEFNSLSACTRAQGEMVSRLRERNSVRIEMHRCFAKD